MTSNHMVVFSSSFPSTKADFPFNFSSIAASPPSPRPRGVPTILFDTSPRSRKKTTIVSTGGCIINNSSCIFSLNPAGSSPRRGSNVSCAVSTTDGQAGDPLDRIVDKAREYWDKLPQPVKCFPWNRAIENLTQLVFDLTVAVIKYLSIPLFAVSSLSELSYCAHERKLRLVPVPLVIGFAVAGIMRETALQSSEALKDAEVPWHLLAIAAFFLLLKLPGPYYPYWGRVFVPHFANGGLLRIFWSLYSWSRKPRQALDAKSS